MVKIKITLNKGDMMKKWINNNLFTLLFLLSCIPLLVQAVLYLSYEMFLFPNWFLMISFGLILLLGPISMIEKRVNIEVR